jgi:hypothetical protein
MSRPASTVSSVIDYEEDFHGWAHQQAELIRTGQLAQLDLDHIAGELEDLGNSQRSELESRLTLILQHLLKWQYQPARRSRSWTNTVIEQRSRVRRLLRKNPSLNAKIDEVVAEAYEYARLRASAETDQVIETDPSGCPWTPGQILEEVFWPQ